MNPVPGPMTEEQSEYMEEAVKIDRELMNFEIDEATKLLERWRNGENPIEDTVKFLDGYHDLGTPVEGVPGVNSLDMMDVVRRWHDGRFETRRLQQLLEAAITRIESTDASWQLELEEQERQTADAVGLAEDSLQAAKILEAELNRVRHNYAWSLIYSHQAFVSAGIDRELTLPGIDPVVVELVKAYKDFPLGQCAVCGCRAALSRLEKMDNRTGLMSCAWGCDDGPDVDDIDGDINTEGGGGAEAEGVGGSPH